MPRRKDRDSDGDTFFSDTLTIAVQLAQLRHDPAALGRVVAALALSGGDGDNPEGHLICDVCWQKIASVLSDKPCKSDSPESLK